MNRFSRFVQCILLVLILGVVACNSSTAQTPAQPPLRFAYDLWPGYYPVLIANEKGYFEEEGIQVEAIKPEDTDQTLADFLGGRYDGIAVSLGDIVNLTQLSEDIYIIFVSDESAGGDAVVAGPAIQTVADLEGNQLGVNFGSFADLFVTTMLEENGLSRQDVMLINLDAAETPAGLASGQIDAGHTWEPYVTEAVENGAHVLFSSDQTPGLIPDVVAFRASTVDERPEDVRAFTLAWFRAVDYWQANPAGGNEAISQSLGIPADTISLEGIRLMTLQDNRNLFTRGTTTASLYYTAELYVEFFVSSGSLSTRPDINKLLNPTFIQE